MFASLPKNRLARMLLVVAALLLVITVYAQLRGRDCDSGTTESFSPDLREDQLVFLDKNFPEDFDARERPDETLLAMIRFADDTTSNSADVGTAKGDAESSGKRVARRSVAKSDASNDFVDKNKISEQRPVFLDVGANRGRFSFDVLSNWGNQRARDAEMRCKVANVEPPTRVTPRVEPIVYAFDVVESRVDALRKLASALLPANTLLAQRTAISDAKGLMEISESNEGPTLGVGKPLGKIETTTLDDFLNEKKLTNVKLVKIDVDGFEPAVIKGALNSIRSGAISQLLFVYGHLWKKEYTGRATDFTLRALTLELEELSMECYLVSKHRLIKVSGDYWDARFELYSKYKYIALDVWCVHHDSPVRTRVLEIYNDPFAIDDYWDRR